MQNILDATVEDRVPGVVAPLTPYNDVSLRSKHVDDLALAFIAPLHSNQNCVRH